LPPQDGVSSPVGQAFQPDIRLESLTYASAADLSPNLEAIQNPQAPFLDPLGLDTLAPPHSTKLPAPDPMGFPSTTHDSSADSGSSAGGAHSPASPENPGFTSPELSGSSPSAGLSLSLAPVSAPATPAAPGSDFTFDSASRLTSPNGPGTVQSFSSPVSVSHKKNPDAMYVLDANKAIVVTPGTADNEFSNTAMDLRMQVSGATVSTYSWDLTNAPDTTGVSGTSTYKLTFNWSSFTGAAKTETILAKQTPQGGSQVTQTLTFKVAGTDSPAWSTAPTNYGTWTNANPLTPDALNPMQQTQQIFGCSCGDNIAVGLAAGDLQTYVVMPAYNPGVPRLGLVYDSIAANTLPIFITHFQIDPGQAVPPTVKAQLTFNGVAGTTVWYTTSLLNPGDIMEIPLQGDATALSTGRYTYSIAVTANYGTPATTTYSGSVDIVNSSGSPFGAGWSLSNVQRIWPVTGGVVLEEPGGLSLWFANGQPAGTFGRPAGDFSTLTQNTQTNVYTRLMPDGTKINFDSTGKQTSIVDRVGNTTSFGYNGSNLLVTITDPYSLVTTLTYNASNKVSTIQDPAGPPRSPTT
jgi:YD repeat-containing protein